VSSPLLNPTTLRGGRIVAFIESFDHVCCRYRLRAFAPAWEAAGYQIDWCVLPRSGWSRFRAMGQAKGADVVIVQRKLLTPWEIAYLRRLAADRLLFDIDDAVWLRDSYSSKGFYSGKRLRRFRAMARASRVVAGNGYLAQHSLDAGSSAAILIPTCVDPDHYPLSNHLNQQAQMVWIGSASTLQGLVGVTELLERIGSDVPQVSLKLICDRFIELKNLPVIASPWSEATESHEIAAADIGISWIPNDDWSRGKCGLKVLQYMAAGLPVVANPVGVHPEMIRHGVNGYLASSPQEWIEAVRELSSNPEKRREMGRAGRERVEKQYSVAYGSLRWLELLKVTSTGRGGA
jgi:glycosyltransferase involved in cell wall biosynthesis